MPDATNNPSDRQAAEERAHIIGLCDELARLVRHNLQRDLSRPEVADLGAVAARALKVVNDFGSRHPDRQPLGGDDVMPLIDARRAVLNRLASFRQSRRPRR
jgi:hypothetical protein